MCNFRVKRSTPKTTTPQGLAFQKGNSLAEQAYFERKSPSIVARQARISQSQFADSHGGDSSNYRF